MRLAIIYTSKTGNTEELVFLIRDLFLQKNITVDVFRAEQFKRSTLSQYDAIVIGTYTWGNGDLPKELVPVYQAFETEELNHLVTGVVGTGDSGYPYFCGAVDRFRDMLFVQTSLAVTLKIEIMPQEKDLHRCKLFVESVISRIKVYT